MSNNMIISKNGERLTSFVFNKYNKNELTDEDLVQNIILCFDLLNLKTISQYAKEIGKTYRGVKEFSKNIIHINNHKFVIDN
jgi:hypothetical protein